jgi:hypothetical protein
MKNLNILKAITLFSAVTFLQVFSASDVKAALCPVSNGVINLDDLKTITGRSSAAVTHGDYNCEYTPDGMRIKIYKIMLCEEYVDNTKYLEKCVSLFDEVTGKSVTVEADKNTSILDGPASLPEGKYNYSVILINNTVDTKFTQTYSNEIHGNNGIGTTCWSNGNDVKISYEVSANGNGDPSKFSASCGTLAQANPQWSGYTYKAFWNDNNNGVDNYFINKFQGIQAFGSAYKDVYVLSNLTEVATVTTGVDGRNHDDGNGVSSNGIYVMGVQKHDTPITISPTTNGLELGFKLKNTFFQKITTNNDYYGSGVTGKKKCSEVHGSIGQSSETGAYACLSTSYPITFDFRIQSN